jgi:outer membrane protein OmpA-like peptidoglycan-associated protein
MYGVALDSDEDGVPDCRDKEPDTPAGCPVDEHGVALDDDKDGVPNFRDLEPSTPSGAVVDRSGREIKKEEKDLIDEGIIRVHKVHFATGSSAITPESYDVLKQIAELLEKYPTLKIQVEGHTDNTGKRESNLKLSNDRAQAVLNFILETNPKLDQGRFSAVGFGPDRPISANETLNGKQMNRRVEFVVLNKEELKKIMTK